MSTTPSPILTAPLAGVSSGLQAQGVWVGRRQLFVRFAGEAETATMYRADALARELVRQLSRSTYHSIAISGRDALGCSEFLAAAFKQVTSPPPVMLDTDGEHFASLPQLGAFLRLVQVTVDVSAGESPRARVSPELAPERAHEANIRRALDVLSLAAGTGIEHALVLVARDDASDGDLVRIVEQAHAASERTAIVIHPGPAAGERVTLDRRWSLLAEQASAAHGDVRVLLRLPGPAALR
jgi:hypothetical protein